MEGGTDVHQSLYRWTIPLQTSRLDPDPLPGVGDAMFHKEPGEPLRLVLAHHEDGLPQALDARPVDQPLVPVPLRSRLRPYGHLAAEDVLLHQARLRRPPALHVVGDDHPRRGGHGLELLFRLHDLLYSYSKDEPFGGMGESVVSTDKGLYAATPLRVRESPWCG